MNAKNLSIPILVIMIISQACDRGPEAGFRIEPENNRETGDTIRFINESIDANGYEWDFGNGETSEDETPIVFYNETGDYTVTLNAINDYGNDTVTKSLRIKNPTVMGFVVSEPDSVTPLSACNIWVYTDTAAWNNFADPEFSQLTDQQGYAEFSNMESVYYYIWIFKETAEGTYLSGGYTPPLELNETNLFGVVTQYFPNEDLKSKGMYSFFPEKIRPRNMYRNIH